ncbi:MAG: hypothetical protein E7680_05765 [Ruminococcaceae bacterium]|nr:hypothetical protein [Oscillospiraceae bacterium]
MAFIVVELQGEKTAGGYLKIDGRNETHLSDDLIIEVSPGTHHLTFSNQSDMREAGKALLNLVTDGTLGNSVADQYGITEVFSGRTIMMLTVVSGPLGEILSAPSYKKAEADDETLKSITEEYAKRMNPSGEYAKSLEEKDTKWFKKSILFSLLTFPTVVIPGILGLVSWWKKIQFIKTYGYKPKGSGLAYFISLISGIGGLVLWFYVLPRSGLL